MYPIRPIHIFLLNLVFDHLCVVTDSFLLRTYECRVHRHALSIYDLSMTSDQKVIFSRSNDTYYIVNSFHLDLGKTWISFIEKIILSVLCIMDINHD